MARTYAKVRIDIWAGDDFRQLTDPAQALYFRLMTSPTLSLAGVADWRPVRLAHLTRGMTAQQLSNAAIRAHRHQPNNLLDDIPQTTIERRSNRWSGSKLMTQCPSTPKP